MTLEQMRRRIASFNILATILLSNNFRIVLAVISSASALEEELGRQSQEDLANVELEGEKRREKER